MILYIWMKVSRLAAKIFFVVLWYLRRWPGLWASLVCSGGWLSKFRLPPFTVLMVSRYLPCCVTPQLWLVPPLWFWSLCARLRCVIFGTVRIKNYESWWFGRAKRKKCLAQDLSSEVLWRPERSAIDGGKSNYHPLYYTGVSVEQTTMLSCIPRRAVNIE